VLAGCVKILQVDGITLGLTDVGARVQSRIDLELDNENGRVFDDDHVSATTDPRDCELKVHVTTGVDGELIPQERDLFLPRYSLSLVYIPRAVRENAEDGCGILTKEFVNGG